MIVVTINGRLNDKRGKRPLQDFAWTPAQWRRPDSGCRAEMSDARPSATINGRATLLFAMTSTV
jgi:hypothetical protein